MSKLRKSKILCVAMIIAIVATIIAPIGSFTASADVVYYTDGENYNFAVSNGEATVIEYIGNGGDITIPSTIYGYPVTAIGDSAFAGCSSLSSVSMPSVITVGSHAFDDCYMMDAVDMPNVKYIGDYAFAYCTYVSRISAPQATTISDYAFFNCRCMVNIDVTSAKVVGANAFDNCFELASVYLPNVTAIGTEAFSGCTFMESVYAPNVTTIGKQAFIYCGSLKTITVADDNPSYSTQDGVLFNKTKTKIITYPAGKTDLSYTVPDSVTSIGDSAFLCCTYLESICMPNVSVVDDFAFYCSYDLASADMPNVLVIGDYAFCNNESLASVTMPKIVNVGEYAFEDCDSNLTIYGYPDTYAQQYANDNAINFEVLTVDKIKDVTYEIVDGKVIFTVTTGAGEYNRVKLTTADNLKGSLVTGNSYTVNSNGDYVWTIKFNAPTETTNYAFDLRSSETGKYLKDYYTCEVEVIPTVKSVSHEVSGGKIIFTVVTSAGDYNRIKLTTADNLRGSLAVGNSYTVDADGNYVWTIKFNAPTETTNYAFDLRSSETGKYLKSYCNYEAEVIPVIKSATHEIANGKVIFTVVTSAGDYNRIKLTTADNLRGSLAVGNSYTVDADGNYVWTIKFNAPTETTNYAIDIRSSETGKYNKEYYYLTV